MKISTALLLLALAVAPRISSAASPCLALFEGWANAQNLTKVPAGKGADRQKFFGWLAKLGIPVQVRYTDATGSYGIDGAMEVAEKTTSATVTQTVLVPQTVMVTTNGTASAQTQRVPTSQTKLVATKIEVVRVTYATGVAEIPVKDISEIVMPSSVKRALATKLNVAKLTQDLLDPRGYTTAPAIAVPTLPTASSSLLTYNRGDSQFRLIYFTSALTSRDPLVRQVEFVVFPTEADQVAFARYLGDKLYRQYFTDLP